MSIKKYILSIHWTDHHQELFSNPYGTFDTFDEAKIFAKNKIEEIKNEFIEEYDEDYVEEYIHCDYTIKSIFI